MSQEALATVIKRALNDPAFRRRLVTDPTALGAFDLTDNETAALRSGDPSRLSAFGIDQRMSKIFMIDPGAGAASLVAGVGSEPRDVEPYWAGDGSDAVTSGGIEPRDVEPVDISSTIHGTHGEF